MMSLYYTAKPMSFEKLNDEFTKMKCYVMAVGKNRNFSHIGMEAVQEALPSLIGIPVVAHLQKKDDGGYYIGGHDRQIIIENDSITANDLTVPFGYVTENNQFEFVEITEKDGTKATYLTANIILWTGRYGEIMEAAYSKDIYFSQSMEINPLKISPLKEDKNYQDIKSFSFSALCLLGLSDEPEYNTEPCFPSSHVEPISYELDKDRFKTEFSLMMSQVKKLTFSIENKTNNKGGDLMDEKLQLLQKYNLTKESIDFEIEELSLEELQVKIDEFVAKNKKTKDLSFSATYRQKREALCNALDQEIVKDGKGNIIEETYYYVNDFSDEWVYVEKYHWTANDNENKYGRFAYTFDSNSLTATITGEFEEMYLTWLTKEEKQKIEDAQKASEEKYSSLQEEFSTYKTNYCTLETEVSELRTFKSQKLETERNEEVEAIFVQFEEKLGGTEEFEALKLNSKDLSTEEITNKCYLLVGKKDFKISSTSKQTNFAKTPIGNKTTDDEPYGGLFVKYNKTNNN
jgi:hypothetical protein